MSPALPRPPTVPAIGGAPSPNGCWTSPPSAGIAEPVRLVPVRARAVLEVTPRRRAGPLRVVPVLRPVTPVRRVVPVLRVVARAPVRPDELRPGVPFVPERDVVERRLLVRVLRAAPAVLRVPVDRLAVLRRAPVLRVPVARDAVRRAVLVALRAVVPVRRAAVVVLRAVVVQVGRAAGGVGREGAVGVVGGVVRVVGGGWGGVG